MVQNRLLARGVWLAPYLVGNGEPASVLIAVDARGVVRKHVQLRDGLDEERATRWLWQLLDRIDPPVQLRLVKPDPAASPVPIDHYADPRSPQSLQRYRARLIKGAAARIRRFE